jgi:hypothetical protein
MFWRRSHTSKGSSDAIHRALDLVRASLLLETPPFDWAAELDWPRNPVESRALYGPTLLREVHHPRLRAVPTRSRAGAVPERPQHCLCPVGHAPFGTQAASTPLARSQPFGRGLRKHAAGC